MRYCPECEAQFRRTDVLCPSCRVRLTDSRGIEGWLPTVTAGLMVLFYLAMYIITSIRLGIDVYESQNSVIPAVGLAMLWLLPVAFYINVLSQFLRHRSEASVYGYVGITFPVGLFFALSLGAANAFTLAVLIQGVVMSSSGGGGPPGDGGGLFGGGGGDGGGGGGGG